MRIASIAAHDREDSGAVVELHKWESYYRSAGHEVIACRGLATGPAGTSTAIAGLDPRSPDNHELLVAGMAARSSRDIHRVDRRVHELGRRLYGEIHEFLYSHQTSYVHVDALLSYPICPPFAVAAAMLAGRGIRIVARSHDFIWERMAPRYRYMHHAARRYLPVAAANILYLTLTKYAMRWLGRRRRGLESMYVPNLFDFREHRSADGARSFRSRLQVADNQLLLVQPTRCVPIKGIHHTIHLASALAETTGRPTTVIVTGKASGGLTATARATTLRYRDELAQLAHRTGVHLIFLEGELAANGAPGHRIRDAYAAANAITFPSAVEGFGNPVVESVAARRPLFTARYPVMVNEFLPHQLDFTLIQPDDARRLSEESWPFDLYRSAVPERAGAALARLIEDPEAAARRATRNFTIARKHYDEHWESRTRYVSAVTDWLRKGKPATMA